jgi:hypothetical protein
VTSDRTSPVVVRPTYGTRRFRRNCWVGVIDRVLVANDRKNRRYEFPLDGSDQAPHAHRLVILDPRSTKHYIDRRGEALVTIGDGSCWDVKDVTAIADAAGLTFDAAQVVPPLRADGVRLEDARWADLQYVRVALAAVMLLVILGRFEVIGIFPWVIVAVGLLGFCLAALLSGRYFKPKAGPETGGDHRNG